MADFYQIECEKSASIPFLPGLVLEGTRCIKWPDMFLLLFAPRVSLFSLVCNAQKKGLLCQNSWHFHASRRDSTSQRSGLLIPSLVSLKLAPSTLANATFLSGKPQIHGGEYGR